MPAVGFPGPAGGLTADQIAAITNATTPGSASNPFATNADVPKDDIYLQGNKIASQTLPVISATKVGTLTVTLVPAVADDPAAILVSLPGNVGTSVANKLDGITFADGEWVYLRVQATGYGDGYTECGAYVIFADGSGFSVCCGMDGTTHIARVAAEAFNTGRTVTSGTAVPYNNFSMRAGWWIAMSRTTTVLTFKTSFDGNRWSSTDTLTVPATAALWVGVGGNTSSATAHSTYTYKVHYFSNTAPAAVTP